MGVAIDARAVWPAKRGTSTRAGTDEVFAAIEGAIRDAVTDPLAAEMLAFEIDPDEECLYAFVHPVAEPLRFMVADEGAVEVEGKTSTLGTGYHLFVLGLLEAIGREEGVSWMLADEEGRHRLPIAEAKNPAAIDREMDAFLRAIAEFATEQTGEIGCVSINMPMADWMPEGFDGVITPSGPFDRAWLKRTASGADLRTARDEFYIWPTAARDARYWRRLGEALMWSEVMWRMPEDEEEEAVARHALDCMDRALEMDPRAPVPKKEIEELRSILESETGQPPGASGIGYARRMSRHSLGGGWSVRLPGYFYRFLEDDGEVTGLAFAERNVRFSSMTFTDEAGRSPAAAEVWEQCRQSEPPGRLVFQSDKAFRRASVNSHEEDDGAEYIAMTCEICVDGGLGHATIVYEDPADEAWALSVLEGVRHDPDDDGE